MIRNSNAKFEEKLTLVWKMTWGICQIFIRTLECVKIGTFMGSFCPKYKMHELKIYREVISNDTEEWWKHLKVSKINNLMGCFWPKYIMFKIKKYRGVIFHDTRERCKIWRKIDFVVCKMAWGIWQIFTRANESLKLGTLIGSFYRK